MVHGSCNPPMFRLPGIKNQQKTYIGTVAQKVPSFFLKPKCLHDFPSLFLMVELAPIDIISSDFLKGKTSHQVSFGDDPTFSLLSRVCHHAMGWKMIIQSHVNPGLTAKCRNCGRGAPKVGCTKYQPPFLFVIYVCFNNISIKTSHHDRHFYPFKESQAMLQKERPSIHHSRKIFRKNPPGLSVVVEVTVTMPSFALGLLITFKTQSGTLGLVGASVRWIDGWSKIPCKARTKLEKNDRVNL